MEKFSFSSLESYKKCPAQFKFRYIDNNRKSDESIEAFMGKRVHEALEYLYNEVLDSRIPFYDHVVDYYNSQWQKYWHDRVGIYDISKSANYYKNLGEDCIARYYRIHTPFEEPIVGNEIKLEFFIDGDENYSIRGIIDRLDHDGDGNWEIHDYKSGKRYMTQQQADKDNQLALYLLGLMTMENKIKSVKLVWHFLRHGIEVHSYRTVNQLKDLSNSIKFQIDKIRNQINNGAQFLPKKSILCNWCYYWEECPTQSGTNPYIKKI